MGNVMGFRKEGKKKRVGKSEDVHVRVQRQCLDLASDGSGRVSCCMASRPVSMANLDPPVTAAAIPPEKGALKVKSSGLFLSDSWIMKAGSWRK